MRSTLSQGINTWDLHWHRGLRHEIYTDTWETLLFSLRHEIYTDTGETLLLLLRHEIYTDTGEPFCHPSSQFHNSNNKHLLNIFCCIYGLFLHFHDYIVTTSFNGGERLWNITDNIFMTISWLPVVMGRKDLTYNWQHFHDYIVNTSCNGEKGFHI